MVILPHRTVPPLVYQAVAGDDPTCCSSVPSSGYMVLLLGLAGCTRHGVTGHIIDIVPTNWRDEAHIPAYGMLTWLVIWGLRHADGVMHAARLGSSSLSFNLDRGRTGTTPSRERPPRHRT